MTSVGIIGGGLVTESLSSVNAHVVSPACRAILECVDARLRRLQSLCTPEVWRLIMECEQHHRAHSLELARQCYVQGMLDATPAEITSETARYHS